MQRLDLDEALAGADLVIVHEWNEQELVQRVWAHRKENRHYRLLFHDTHHRSVTDAAGMDAHDLSGFDGVLAYGGNTGHLSGPGMGPPGLALA